jgi:Mannosyl-glycoprotein endo-beta-N-acetylglucosaminidase
MTKTIQKLGYKLGMTLAFMPFLSMPTADTNLLPINFLGNSDNNEAAITIEDIRKERALKIEKYYSDRSMPLAKHAMDFVLVAEKYGLDWTLLPSIAIRESSGGKNDCYNNPFGWGSCKIKYNSYKDSIEAVGKNLGGSNPRTSSYYAGKTSKEKLYYYNGTVVPTYPDEVLSIMEKIRKTDTENYIELAVK